MTGAHDYPLTDREERYLATRAENREARAQDMAQESAERWDHRQMKARRARAEEER